MEVAVIHFIFLGVISGLTEGAGVLTDGPLNAAVGGKVIFTTTLTPGTPFGSVIWKFGDKEIFTFFESNLTSPEYEGRIIFFMSTGSLELRNLALTDSGEYSVTILEPGGVPPQTGSTRLNVEEPVSNVMVTSSSTELVEFSSSVSLSCSSSGSSLSFLWLNSSSEVTGSDRVQITDGGSTLTIVNVTCDEQGPFSCQVFNPVSNGTSDPLILTIYCLTEGAGVLPDGLNAAVGGKVMFNTTLTPGASFQIVNWRFGSKEIFTWNVKNFTAPEYEGRITFFMSTGSLELRNLALTDSGGYSVTILIPGERPQSGITRLEVYEPVSNVMVTSSSTELVEFSSVSLSCSSSGSSLSFHWLKSSSEVTRSDRVQITDGGSTLTIVNVTRYDQGPFSCRVSNPVSEGTSAQLTLTIYYGPDISDKRTPSGRIRHDHSAVESVYVTRLAYSARLLARKPNKKLSAENTNTNTRTGVEGQDNGAYPRSQEMHYADVRFSKKNNGGTVQMRDQNKPLDYAEVRVNNNPLAAASSLPTYDAPLQRNRKPAPQPENAELYAQVRKN